MFAYAWPWSIALFIPLALLVFPDGLLPGRFWRAVVWFTVVSSPVFVLGSGADPTQVVGGRTLVPWLVLADYPRLAPLWIATEVAELAVLVVAVVGLVLRYRRGDEQRRRQLLWLVLALILMIVVVVPWGLFAAGPILELLSIALVPAAMTIAVLRYQLLDIRLVLSRTVLYVLLTGAVVVVYLGFVAAAELMLRRRGRARLQCAGDPGDRGGVQPGAGAAAACGRAGDLWRSGRSGTGDFADGGAAQRCVRAR